MAFSEIDSEKGFCLIYAICFKYSIYILQDSSFKPALFLK